MTLLIARTQMTAPNNIRQQIIRAASVAFARRGYDRTTMRDIARELDIEAPSMYHYFPDKGTLLYCCLEQAFLTMTARALAAIARKKNARAKLAAFVEANTLFQLEATEIHAIYHAKAFGVQHETDIMNEEQRGTIKALERSYLNILRTILRDGVGSREFKKVDVTLVAFAIIGMGEHATGWFRPQGRLSAQGIASAVAKLALRLVA